MARVVQVDVIDNGIILQSDPRVEGKEGIVVFVTRDEAIAHITELLDSKIAEKGVTLSNAAPTVAKATLEKSEGAPIQFPDKKANPAQGPELPDGDDGHHLPPGFSDTGAYEAELRRLVDDNDRDAAHARLKAHVDAGRVEPYKPRLGIKNLVDLIRQGDKLGGAGSEEGEALPAEKETTNAAPNGTLPSGAAIPEGVPPPTGHDPFAIGPTREEVQAALQAAAGRTDVNTAFGVLKQLGYLKITELPAELYGQAIESANAIK